MSDLTDNYFYPSAEWIWFYIRLNNAGKYCDITLKIMVVLQNVRENCVRILEEAKHRQIRMFVILWKKWSKLASSSIKQSVKSQIARILPLWQKMCVKHHQHQFTVVLNNWIFWRHHWNEFCIKALVRCGPAYRKCRFWQKKIIFPNEAHFDLGGYVNKQNSLLWGTENPHAHIGKPTHPKRVTVWYWYCSRDIIGPFFFENEQRMGVTVNGDHYRAMLNEYLFTINEEENIDNIWFQ